MHIADFPRSTEQNLTDTPRRQYCGRVCCVTPIGWHPPVPATHFQALSSRDTVYTIRVPGRSLILDIQFSCKKRGNVLKEE